MFLTDKKPKCASIWDRKYKNINDDYILVKTAHDILQDVELIVTYNGKKFDMKHLNTRIMYHRYHGRKDLSLKPLPKIKHIDLLQVMRQNYLMYSNKLGKVGKFFNVGEKEDTGGWDLWVDVYQGKKSAQRKMTSYCKQDVMLLKKLYLELRSLLKGIPNYNQFFKEETNLCPNCGSTRLHNAGTRVSGDKIQQRLRCYDCGTWSFINKSKLPKAI